MIALETYLGLRDESARLAAVKVYFLGNITCLFILIFVNIMHFIYSVVNTHEILIIIIIIIFITTIKGSVPV